MVIAGTGTPQILTARIGKILLETDVLLQNILFLTYTDAGAIAMRKRLLQFMGPDSYKVNHADVGIPAVVGVPANNIFKLWFVFKL